MIFNNYDTWRLPADEEKQLVQLLSKCYDEYFDVIKPEEELCRRVMVFDGSHCVAHGAGYLRKMVIGDYHFTAGIIGGMAVDPVYRRQGIAKKILSSIHESFRSNGVAHSFLFANEPKVYMSSGYKMLKNEMHVFDTYAGKWQTFVWQNSMSADLTNAPLPPGLLQFNGCNY